MIDYICAYGIKVSIITNGSLLTKERIAFWKGKVCCIGLSIDSALSETNAAIGRSCNSKQLTDKQMVSITQAIHRNGIELKINTVVSKFNVNEDMRVIYKRLKPNKLKLLQVEIVDGINDCANKFAISKKEFDRFCARHKSSCHSLVCESERDMENSYLMINPQGELQLNDNGKYFTYGSCLEEDLDDILLRTPISADKFYARYGKQKESMKITKKICIFGGHPTWMKGLKECLVNAIFIKDGNLRNIDVVRNADEIWIQPNAISHSLYGKVKAVAQLNGIPIRYFDYAGTKKCLEQVFLKEAAF